MFSHCNRHVFSQPYNVVIVNLEYHYLFTDLERERRGNESLVGSIWYSGRVVGCEVRVLRLRRFNSWSRQYYNVFQDFGTTKLWVIRVLRFKAVTYVFTQVKEWCSHKHHLTLMVSQKTYLDLNGYLNSSQSVLWPERFNLIMPSSTFPSLSWSKLTL